MMMMLFGGWWHELDTEKLPVVLQAPGVRNSRWRWGRGEGYAFRPCSLVRQHQVCPTRVLSRSTVVAPTATRGIVAAS